MAATVVTIESPHLFSMVGGNYAPFIRHYQANTGETWSFGRVLKLATGKASLAVAGDSPLLGIALSENPFVTRTDITEYPVLVFTNECLYEFNVWVNDTQTDTANSLVLATHVGSTYRLALSGTPNAVKSVVDIGNAASVFRIIDLASGPGKGVFGTTHVYQRVIVEVVDAARAYSI